MMTTSTRYWNTCRRRALPSLLAHEPDVADQAAASERFALQLSGHTHGGQVRLPLLNRAHVLPSWGQHYTGGLARAGAMPVYTNRGLGMIRPWLRFKLSPGAGPCWSCSPARTCPDATTAFSA